jgi:hypothetical protein
MINDNVRLQTLYKNKKSSMLTYFFTKINNKLYGVRKQEASEWKWATAYWSSYSDPELSERIIDISDDELAIIQRLAVDALFTTHDAHNLMI